MSKSVEFLQAEIDMLRGVGCGEDGDGPCGACLKCARRDAERYAYLRSMAGRYTTEEEGAVFWMFPIALFGTTFDAAVDNARCTQ